MKKVLLNFLILLLISVTAQNAIAVPDREYYGQFYEEMVYAEDLLTQSKAHQAISLYLALILKDPSYTPAKLELATVYMRQTKYVEAEKIILSVLNSSNPPGYAYERLAYCYYLWSFDDKINKQHFITKAFDAIRKGIEIDKFNKNLYATLALLYIEYENYAEAQKMLNIARDLDPLFCDTFINWGILYTKLGNYQKALECFEQAIDLDTKSARAYKELGKMLEASGQYRQTVVYLKKSRFYDIYIKYQEYYLMATLYERLGMLEEAIEEFYLCLELKPDYVDCYTNIAELYETLGMEEKSIEAYRKAIALDYNILETFISQAKNFMMEHDFVHSRALYSKVLKIEPGNKFAYQGLASMYYLSRLTHNFDVEKWYIDQSLMEDQFTKFSADNNMATLMLLKFYISMDDFTDTNKQRLLELSRLYPKTAEDYAARGEALFLLEKYKASNEVLNNAIDKYIAQYASPIKDEKYLKEMIWFAERLSTYHEVIASKKIFDLINNDSKNDDAVNGLAFVADIVTSSENKYRQLIEIKKTNKDYDSMMIEELNKIIINYPQYAEAHYLLSEFYKKIDNYDLALKELLIYLDLKDLTPFDKMPPENKVRKLMEKYNKLNKNKDPSIYLF